MMTWHMAYRLVFWRGLSPLSSEYESDELKQVCEQLDAAQKHIEQLTAVIAAKGKSDVPPDTQD